METNEVNLKITSFEDLKSYKAGQLVELPPFADGQPFVAKLRRPSMMVLAKEGKIPNDLLGVAGQLFAQGGAGLAAKSGKDDTLKDMYEICNIICNAALVSPTMQQIEDAGMELSDDQMIAIFNYSQTGVKSLKTFRS